MEIILNTVNSNVLISYKGRHYNIRKFMHPLRKVELYMFETTKPILEDAYPLHGLMSKKKRYANIFDSEMQIKVKDYMKK